MQKPNYQKMLESIIAAIPEGEAPKLLLHSCCAPCSSYCLEYLSQYFRITLLYYNPNISPEEEFRKRVEELRRLVRELPMKHPAEVVVPEYRPEEFYSAVKGMESLPEGGERCFVCYRLRLERSAQYAAEHGFDYFCSTLSISPMKNAAKLNEIGGAFRAIPSEAAALRLQEKRRLPALHRAFQGVRAVPPELLRLRVLKAGGSAP